MQPPLKSTQQEANRVVSDRNYLGNAGRQGKGAEIWPRGAEVRSLSLEKVAADLLMTARN